MKNIIKKLSPLFLLTFVAVIVLIPTNNVSATTLTFPSAYSNCLPYTVTFSLDKQIYSSLENMEMSGSVQQNATDDCFANQIQLGGATSGINASGNFLINVINTPTPQNTVSGGPTNFMQAQGSGDQVAYFRFNLWEMCGVGGSCGTYSATITAIGLYTYTIGNTPYCVGDSCSGGGGSGGGGTLVYPNVSFWAQPETIYTGGDSTIYWDANNAAGGCDVTDGAGYSIGSNTSGSYPTGPLYEDTTYHISCTGSLALGPNSSIRFAKSNIYLNKLKTLFLSIAPNVFAEEINPIAPVIGVYTTVHVIPVPPVIVTLDYKEDNVKDLVKKGSSNVNGIGTSQLEIMVDGLTSGGCALKNNIDGTTLDIYENDPIFQYIPVSNLINDNNNFQLDCLGSSSPNLKSAIVPVLAQSGTLTVAVGGPSCVIASGASSCYIPLNWNTTNPKSGITTYFENAVPNTSGNSGSYIGTVVSGIGKIPNGGTTASVNIKIKNKVDGEGGTISAPATPVENELASLPVTISCITGTAWNNSICAPTATIDLTASAPTPSSATANVATTFTSTISNIGNTTTGISFNNFFQVASSADGAGNITDKTSTVMAPLGAGGTNTTTVSHTFATAGTYSIRACADKSSSASLGVITETNASGTGETNNCSDWTNVIVGFAPRPDLIAQAPTFSPATITAGANATLYSVITNQGTATTSIGFRNFFQVSSTDPNGIPGGGSQASSLFKNSILSFFSSFISKVSAAAMTLFDFPADGSGIYTIALGNGSSRTISYSSTSFFPSNGAYWVRACADKSNRNSSGTIAESNENNNCSAWTQVIVGSAQINGVCSDPDTHYQCSFGTSANQINGNTSWTWNCNGINGGTSASCSETKTITAPTVTTVTPVTAIASTTATGGGTVVSNGGATVTVSGIIWSTNMGPTIALSTKTTDGWALGGPWASGMTGLSPSTLYYYRAYATNSIGTSYGAVITFTTSKAVLIPTGTITAKDCTIASGSDNCDSALEWTTTNPLAGATSAVTTPTDITVATRNSGTATYLVEFGTRDFYLYHNSELLDQATATASCASGSAWDKTDLKCVPSSNVVPTIASPTVSSIDKTSATLGANVTSLGIPAVISARGTCWGTTPSPTTNCTPEGLTSLGVYTHSRIGLTPGTSYYYRGYAINTTGIGYSIDGIFNTSSPIDGGITIDFKATPDKIFKGKSSTLTWNSTYADSCTGIGFSTGTGNPADGSVKVSPTVTTIYKINCENSTSFLEKNATVKVIVLTIKEN